MYSDQFDSHLKIKIAKQLYFPLIITYIKTYEQRLDHIQLAVYKYEELPESQASF